MKKKVICFSLWGNNPKYTLGAIENAKLAKVIYPDWICRFYIGKTTARGSGEIIDSLKTFPNVELIFMEEEGDWTGMFWRFRACSDESVIIMLSRDCDSRLNYREKLAVKQWLKSGKDFHIMRDHPLHKYLILGGLWGAKTRRLKNMDYLIDEFLKEDRWNIDQEFLEKIIYPLIKNSTVIHDGFNPRYPFPSKRKGLEFVGEVFSENNVPNENARHIIQKEIKKRRRITYKLKHFRAISLGIIRGYLGV